MGEDCLPGTDDDTPDEDPRCEGYPAGWYYDEELCQCVSSGAECEVTCEGDLYLDPVSKCTCLTTFELGPLYSNACDPKCRDSAAGALMFSFEICDDVC